jgi:hypothetical protein
LRLLQTGLLLAEVSADVAAQGVAGLGVEAPARCCRPDQVRLVRHLRCRQHIAINLGLDAQCALIHTFTSQSCVAF